MIEKIYEIVDHTDDEMYFALGIFLTFEDAKKNIVGFPKEKSITEDAEDIEVLKIFEREIGFNGPGREVFSLTREEYYDEEKDEYYWKETEIIEN